MNFRKLFKAFHGKCTSVHDKKFVYLLDREDGYSTRKFADEFQYFVDWKIEFVPVKSPDDCVNDYSIALLLRRVTDRAEEDIGSILQNVPRELYGRIALINIHVFSNRSFLPRIPTGERVNNFLDLGTILDFGLVNGKITLCNCNRNSKQIFNNFVLPNGGRNV